MQLQRALGPDWQLKEIELLGLDYAFGSHPSITSLKAYGAGFVGRYVSAASNDANGKNLTLAEKNALLAGGMAIILFFENAANRMLGGKAAGIADAEFFDAKVKALGMPGAVGYFGADFDATQAQQAPINAYLQGVASVIGIKRTGLYGGFYVVERALNAGLASFTCQTLAWSGGQWDSRASIRQGLSVTVDGVSCDPDTSMVHDFGQWPRPVSPPPAPTYPVPKDLRAVPVATVSLSWQNTGSPHYRFQVAQGTPAKPGVSFVSKTITGCAVSGLVLTGPGPWIWRVQGAGNSPFTAWQPITLK